jgi:DegV family protein with EDD domain
MPGIKVVTDSTADFADAPDALGITVVPLAVLFGNDAYRDKLDLSVDAFYARLRTTKLMPTTSAPSVGAFEATYRQLLENADHVISVHLAARLSATCEAARTAARNVAPERVTVLDSGQVTLCLGWMAAHAAQRAAQGAGVDAIVSELERMFPRLRVYAVLDTLEFLQRGGRIGKASALVGALLSIKPIIVIDRGEVLPFERVRTRTAAVRRLVDVVSGLRVERIGILHGDDSTAADEAYRILMAREPTREISRGQIGAVLGTHAGPGVFGAAVLLAE